MRIVCHARSLRSLRALTILTLLSLVQIFTPVRAGAQNVTLTPVINTVAGKFSLGAGYGGDGGAATSAQMNQPVSIAVDSAGNIYIADQLNYAVRKVDTHGNMSTVAGVPTDNGYSGDGGAATSALLSEPNGIAVDKSGNVYISDRDNNVIRVVNTQSSAITVAGVTIQAGNIATVAGNQALGAGYSGNGGPALSAQLHSPAGLSVDAAGNIYVADWQNNVIRKISTAGTITVVAGSTSGYSGDGGSATSAQISDAFDVSLDANGNLYIADKSNNVIRVVNTQASTISVAGVSIAAGTIATVAGNQAAGAGYTGDNGPATSAQLNDPIGATPDGNGNIYIADCENNVVRKVDANGVITTFAGNNTLGYSGDGQSATQAELDFPSSISLDSNGNVYIADWQNNLIREVTGVIAGGAVNFGAVNLGSHSSQTLFLSINTNLTLTSVQSSGDFSVTSNSCTMNTSLSTGTLCTLHVQFAPTAPGRRGFALVATDNTATKYSFGLTGVGIGSALAFNPGVISLMAGNGTASFGGDGGTAVSAQLNHPYGVAMDGAGNLYIADRSNNVVRKVNTSGNISTIAGVGGVAGYSGDGGAATSAHLKQPNGVAVDSASNLYIADTGNNVVRKVDVNGNISTVAGNNLLGDGYTGDGGAATSATLDSPTSVAVDAAGNLYIADWQNSVIRKVFTDGVITTFAGLDAPGSNYGYSGDNGVATSAKVADPFGVAVDSLGNVFIADTANNVIRRVDTNSIITTVAGNHTSGAGYGGDNGTATSAQLNQPLNIAVDAAGDIYIADTTNNVIRKVNTSGTITTVAGNNSLSAGYSGDNGAATSAALNQPGAIAVDNAGNLYIGDSNNNRVRAVSATSTPTLAFGSLNIDQTSSAQSFGVSGVGNSALDLTNISIAANFTAETVGNDCVANTPLAIGGSCNIGVAFAPTSVGSISGSVVLTDNAITSPHSVQLSGTGTQTATSLSYTQAAPTTLVAGNSPGVIKVGIYDAFNNLVTGSSASVTVTITGPNSYSNGLSANAASGVATLNFSSVNLNAAGSYTVTATSSGLTSAVSNITVSAASGSGVALNGGSGQSATVGVAFSTAFSVTVTDSFSNPVAGVNVTFAAPGTGASGTFTGSATVATNASGIATAPTFTANHTAGSYSVTATASGIGTPVSFSLTNNPGTAGSIAVNAGSGQSALVGTAFSTALSAKVTDSFTNPISGASVTFAAPGSGASGAFTGSATVTTNASGIATAPTFTANTTSGAYSVTASVAGVGTPASFSLTNTAATSSTSVSANPTSSTYGQSVTFTATVTVGSGTATGSVTFSDGLTTLGNGTLSSGTATYTTSALAGGSHSIKATYAGNATYAGSASSALTFAVSTETPTVNWTAPAAITYGTALSATQLDATVGGGVAGTFSYTPALGAVLPAGNQTLSVTFTPSNTTDYGTANANVSLVVNQAPLSLTANSATHVFGSALPQFTGTMSGEVTGDQLTETYSTSATVTSPVGAYAIVPAVSGASAANYTVTANNGTLTVTKANSSVTLISGNTKPNQNSAVTFTATAGSATSGTPTGQVNFYNGSTLLGSGTLNGQGVATYNDTTGFAVGSDTITASYAGDQNFNTSTSASVTETIVAPDYSVVASPASLTLHQGQSGTITFTITPVGGFTGNVQFACQGMPLYSTCGFQPSPAALDGSNTPVTVTMTVNTTAAAAALEMPAMPGQPSSNWPAGLFFLPNGLAGLVIAGAGSVQRKNRRRWLAMLVLAILLIAILALSGCGAASSSSSSHAFTPTGTFTVTVTTSASAGGSSTQHNASVSITIVQ